MKSIALQIVKKLQDAGHTAYWAGGCVRDQIMGKEPKDYDIASSARPEQIEQLFGHTKDVGRQFGVMLVIEKGHVFEIATFRSDSGYSDGRRPDAVLFTHAADDALRRDFTINGLFFDPVKEEIHDFVGGRDDIEDGIIRFIGEPSERIKEDHLRIIRAIRFKSTLAFRYHDDTKKALMEFAHLAGQVSFERARDELNKILASPNTKDAFQDMKELAVLKEILPELAEVPWDDFLAALDRLPVDAPPLAHWATIFHFIGGPQDLELPHSVMRRLRFSRKDREDVNWVIRHFSLLADLPKMPLGRQRHWFLESHFGVLLMLLYAIQGDSPLYTELLKEYEHCISRFDFCPQPLLTGEEVMQTLKLAPGPKVGELLQELVEKQLAHEIDSHEAALKWLKGAPHLDLRR